MLFFHRDLCIKFLINLNLKKISEDGTAESSSKIVQPPVIVNF
jgi:hypothetical protein